MKPSVISSKYKDPVSPVIPRSRRGASPDTVPLLPPLKWAGGKRWQIPHLRPLWEPHTRRRLVEPFCGGLAVALGLRPGRALLNDINPHVIAFYGWLKRGLRIDLPMRNDERLYYAHRARFNEQLAAGRAKDRETVALFYYLNRTGYNGLCRFNRKGAFNVPFGRYTTITYRRDFSSYRDAFARWEFTSRDLEKIPLERGDFIYADPPYDVEFTDYSKEGFTWEDQVRAAEWLARAYKSNPGEASSEDRYNVGRMFVEGGRDDDALIWLSALSEGDALRAVEYLQHATAQWQALGRPYDQARTLTDLGRALVLAGDAGEARAAVA